MKTRLTVKLFLDHIHKAQDQKQVFVHPRVQMTNEDVTPGPPCHEGEPLDAISTSMALHHLPDFWKQKALQRLNGMLKDGGRFFLMDVVFSEENCESNIQAWIDKLTRNVGPNMAEDISRHVRKEYSTFTWIMGGLLARAGFRIDNAAYADGVVARYLCTKITPC